MLKILPPNNPILSEKADYLSPQEMRSEETQKKIKEMVQIAIKERKLGQDSAMVGLAAPQVGWKKRVILVDMGITQKKGLGSLEVLINPEILKSSDEQALGPEGCYSVDSKLVGMVKRAKSVNVRAFNQQGELFTKQYSGFTARILQHEIDHLDGIRFPDRVGKQGKGGLLCWMEFGKKKAPWSEWLKMKAVGH